MASWTLPIDEWVSKVKNMDIPRVYRGVAMIMLRRLVLRSPVKTGRFRGNWQAQVDSQGDDVIDLVRGPDDVFSIERGHIDRWTPSNHSIWLFNNLPYAQRLEYGWSKQAPEGMVRVTLSEVGAIVDEAVASGEDGV